MSPQVAIGGVYSGTIPLDLPWPFNIFLAGLPIIGPKFRHAMIIVELLDSHSTKILFDFEPVDKQS